MILLNLLIGSISLEGEEGKTMEVIFLSERSHSPACTESAILLPQLPDAGIKSHEPPHLGLTVWVYLRVNVECVCVCMLCIYKVTCACV